MQSRWTYVVSVPAQGATKGPVDVNPAEVAVTTMLPAAPVERTIARTLPLNALRLVPLYDDVSIGLPLSTPTSWPGPETAKLTELSALGTITPFASWMSPVMKVRSLPSALIVVRSADSATRAAAPAVRTWSVATTAPPRLHSARTVPDAHATLHSRRSVLAVAVFDPCDALFKNSSTLSQLL